MKKLLGVLALIVALLGLATSAPQASTVAARVSVSATAPVNIAGVDLHDGNIVYSGGLYYLYGTEYGCGFQWKTTSPWCGYGVSTATSLAGPWSAPTLLFSPTTVDPNTGLTWANECGHNGWGCFVPRMVQRSGWGANDGVWILYFPVVYDYLQLGQSSYTAMGCNGPAGPCGYTAPYGSVHHMAMHQCNQVGDASYFNDGAGHLDMICTMNNQTLNEEQIDTWGTTGTGTGATNLATMTNTESGDVYRDASGAWILTYADPNCGYCQGTGTGYATGSGPLGPWSYPGNTNLAWAAPAAGRRDLSATSCGGQASNVFTDPMSSQTYEIVDLWEGTANETGAPRQLEPLNYVGDSTAPGVPWQPFAPWSCN